MGSPDPQHVSGADGALSELESRLARHSADRYPVQHATAAFHLATAYLARGRGGEALGLLDAAQGIFGRLGLRLEHAKTQVMYGVTLRETGHTDRARQAFESAAGTFAELDQPAEQGAAAYNLGLVLQDQANIEAAQQAMSAAQTLFLQAGQPAQAGAACREQGAALLQSGRADLAAPLLEEAAALAERGRDLPGLGMAANVLGLAQLAMGQPEAAVASLSRAVGAFPRSLRPAEHAMAKANLALAYEQSGLLARARLAARQAGALGGADPRVRELARDVLDRIADGAQLDLLAVLETEPQEKWGAIVREEALRWVDAPPAERDRAVSGFVDGLLSRPEVCYDLAESFLGVLLELPPDPYHVLVTAVVEASAGRSDEDDDRIRAVTGSAMARFAIPQWQRLASSFNAAATAHGQPASWR